MKKILVVIDYQNDFVDGSLGTSEAVQLEEHIKREIKNADVVVYTKDTHDTNYMESMEGSYLPVEHCIKGTKGHDLYKEEELLALTSTYTIVEKPTFGSFELLDALSDKIDEESVVRLVGVCTDICVISNAVLLKTKYPQTRVEVVADACAGVTVDKHKDALSVLSSLQVDVL